MGILQVDGVWQGVLCSQEGNPPQSPNAIRGLNGLHRHISHSSSQSSFPMELCRQKIMESYDTKLQLQNCLPALSLALQFLEDRIMSSLCSWHLAQVWHRVCFQNVRTERSLGDLNFIPHLEERLISSWCSGFDGGSSIVNHTPVRPLPPHRISPKQGGDARSGHARGLVNNAWEHAPLSPKLYLGRL